MRAVLTMCAVALFVCVLVSVVFLFFCFFIITLSLFLSLCISAVWPFLITHLVIVREERCWVFFFFAPQPGKYLLVFWFV